MKTSPTFRPTRALILLALLPLGCLFLQRGDAEPLAAAAPPPPVFAPPLGLGLTPEETVTVAAEGGVLTLASSTRIAVPENAFVDTAGHTISEPVALTVREFHNPIETWLGGIPMRAGDDAVLRSAGMMEIRGTSADGREVELAPGKVLQLEWYSVEDDPGYVTWALDTATGQWTETGTANTLETRDLQAELEETERLLQGKSLEQKAEP